MQLTSVKLGVLGMVMSVAFCLQVNLRSQEAAGQQGNDASAAQLPAVPQGVEVLARGPVHEAFASPTTEPVPTKPVPKQPPKSLDEMPPAEKPEGNVLWIGGYWAWDDERNDFLWVSGTWRTPPPGKRWVAGYWREDGDKWTWVPGFWTKAEDSERAEQPVNYLPEPPAAPEVAPPGEAPAADSFYVPGAWVWHDAGYVNVGGNQAWHDAGYSWSAGYWARVQPGYVWVPAHYRWTPGGYIYIAGYWDLAIAHRGFLYAPVYVDSVVVGPTFVYTPAYAVRDTVVIDAMFVRPCYCHYYFGDYYGPAYVSLGFESCAFYSRRHYDAVFVYERWDHRADPGWAQVQIDICLARNSGRAACPPRTLVQQNTIIQQNITNVTNVTNVNNVNNTTINRTTVNNNSQVLMPTSQLAAAKGVRTVPLDPGTQMQAKQQAQAIQQVAMQRTQSEAPVAAGKLIQPRASTLNVPAAKPVTTRMEAANSARTNVGPAGANSPRGGPALSHTTAPAGSAQPYNPSNQRPGQPGASPPGQPSRTPTFNAHPPAQFQRKPPPRPPQRPMPNKSDKGKDGH
jgi:hypothetical protein